jgi:RHS repeat-associated protein
MVTSQSGTIVARHDYMPFGEEIPAGYAGRPTAIGSSASPWNAADGVSQRFTGKERDSESVLDYFGARYYGSALGRFTSPDDGSDQTPGDPQSWNLYSYVRNNPARGGQLTEAGRALQKHANRSGSAFSGTTGPPSAWNQQGEQVLEQILNDPGATSSQGYNRNVGTCLM